MSKYKPMLIHFDEASYKRECNLAEAKKQIVLKALDWVVESGITNTISHHRKQKFLESFTAAYKEMFYKEHKNKVQLDISVDKIMELMEVDISYLQGLEAEYNKYMIDLFVNDKDEIDYHINKRKYESYTRSAKQNQILKDTRNFVQALDKISKHTHIYPVQIQIATSNLLTWDMREAQYRCNMEALQVAR